MNSERDWAAAIQRMTELISPGVASWPSTWRCCLASVGEPTCVPLYTSLSEDRLLVAVVETGGGEGLADELARLLVRVGLISRSWATPAQALGWMNRGLLQLGLEPPVIGLTLATLDATNGNGLLARAGLPPPVILHQDDPPINLIGPAPFLGVAEVDFSDLTLAIPPGARLVLASAGRPDQIAAAAMRHEELPGQPFAESLAKDLHAQTAHPSGVLVVVLEHLPTFRIAG